MPPSFFILSSVVQKWAFPKINGVSTFISEDSFCWRSPLGDFWITWKLNKLKVFFFNPLILLPPVLSRWNQESPTGREPKRFLSANSLTYCPGSDTFLCQQQISENSSNEQWHLFSFVEGSVSLKIVAKCFDAKSKNFRPTAAKWAILRCA